VRGMPLSMSLIVVIVDSTREAGLPQGSSHVRGKAILWRKKFVPNASAKNLFPSACDKNRTARHQRSCGTT
jgi:hypothetical protein